jgi:hypothetical protein
VTGDLGGLPTLAADAMTAIEADFGPLNAMPPQDHAAAFAPAGGSSRVFVQSSPFLEHDGSNTARKVVFCP